ncbi:hypothetical protein F66182_17368, partial [Fusarium sp. NRRL 66182]
MAVSPLISQSPAGASVSTSTASKAKSLAVRSGSQGAPASPFRNATATSGLSDQMNDNVRRRYVKERLDKKLGEGTYAVVYLGYLRETPSSLVAIKKIKVNAEYRDGLSMDAIREIKYLQELSHPNIIALHDVFSSKDQNLNLVLEFLPLGDLEMLIKDGNIQYGVADVKAWMGMLTRGVWFCHENFVLHRDIKPNNLLIASDGEVKLADFGLARPPELLYGARQYSAVVDVWSM